MQAKVHVNSRSSEQQNDINIEAEVQLITEIICSTTRTTITYFTLHNYNSDNEKLNSEFTYNPSPSL